MDGSGLPYVKNYYHVSRMYNNKVTVDALAQGDWFYLSYTNLVNGSVVLTDDAGASTGRTYEVDNTYGKIRFTSGGAYTGTLWIDYMHHEASGWSTLADDTALEIDTWYTIGAMCNGGSLTLYVDQVAVATLSSDYCDNEPGTDLVAGFVGDWDSVMYSGNASGSNLVNFPSSGNWEKTIALAGDRAVRYIEAEVALSDEHSISMSFAFADDADNLLYVRGWSYSSFVDGYNRFYPPQGGLYHGTNLLIKISLSEGDYDREAVLIDYLKVYLREPATPLQEHLASPYEDLAIEDVTAEDLSDLIAQVQANRTVIRELSRTVLNLERPIPNQGGGGLPGDPGLPGSGTPDISWADRFAEFWTANRDLEWRMGALEGVTRSELYLLNKLTSSHTGDIAQLFALQNTLLNIINVHTAATTSVHGIADTAALATSGDISTHAGLTTGVHGVGAQYVALTGNPATTVEYKISTAIGDHAFIKTGIHGVGASEVASKAGITDHNSNAYAHTAYGSSLYLHAIDTTNIHGIANTGVLATSTYVGDEIGFHAALSSNVHGTGTDYVAHSGYTQSVEEYIAAHEGRCTNYAT